MSAQPPAAIADRLLPDETVLWWDRPSQDLFLLTPRDALLIPFGLLWAQFGVPFLLIGLLLILGRFLLDAWLRAGTHYALTDRRALIVRTGPWASFRAINLDQLPEITLNERSDGRGTIRFGPPLGLWEGGLWVWGYFVPALDPTPQFLAISEARQVYAAIQEQTQGPSA